MAPASAEPGPALEMLWRARADSGLEWRTFDNAGKPIINKRMPDPPASETADSPFAQRTPLGSIWKLFVYLWLVEQRHPAPDYVCTKAQSKQKEEAYCCSTGQSIGRELALVRSCGLFFEPQRLGISPEAWRVFWEAQPGVRDAAPWLAELGAMKPETVVSPASILHALEAAPVRAREEAASTLLARLFVNSSPGSEATGLIRGMGGRLRVKSFSWRHPEQPTKRYGGGAGWLNDGRPVWFAGEGTGQQVIARHGAHLAGALTETLLPDSGSATPGCVRVNFFARYPFELEQSGGKAAPEGILQGRFIARFQSGVSIPFSSSGELALSRPDGRARIEGRFGLDDYVARVIDREADAQETEAARALSVVIRTYLINEAGRQGNCFIIDDSSRKQRVSIHPPSQKARAAASFTAGLALLGAQAGYHSTAPSENRMAWTDAVSASRSGEAWDVILQKNFPKSNLSAMNDPAGLPCRRFTEAQTWLASRAPQWHRILYQHLPGFNEPAAPPDICLLPHGTPFSEQDRGRIHVRALRSVEDRITLAHEYLHLGLRHHPSSHDEELIERWARKLVVESMP
ncbi:MAG: DUF2300 domain-containing protein [Betaproteobacteria bacterium]|nr:DUF2300 domain-containing protein [Betaproteobacteria bacterium]